jgi:predicted Fe-Mo cluster-binding NifX family protein
LYVDQIYWSQRAAEMADDVLAFQRTVGCEGTDLLISGQISARAMSELQKRGVHAFAVTP